MEVRLLEKEQVIPVSPLTMVIQSVSLQILHPSLPPSRTKDLEVRLTAREGRVRQLEAELRGSEGRVKELEMELLSANERLASGANDHAHRMREQATQLDQCKAGRYIRSSVSFCLCLCFCFCFCLSLFLSVCSVALFHLG